MTSQKPNLEALNLLLSRRSVKSRDMAMPAPNAKDLETILSAAIRVPDHGKLTPWRYVVLESAGQEQLGESITKALIKENETSEKVAEKMAGFATQAPLLIVAIFNPERDHAIPLDEQKFSMGAACMNMLLATHALGYAGLWLTGWASRSPSVAEDLGLSKNEQIAGFMFIGTPQKVPNERPRPNVADITSFGMPTS